MTSVLRDLQEQYEQRARMAAAVPLVTPPAPIRVKATRTYSGDALERRRAWGRFWGQSNSRAAARLDTP